MKCWLNCPLKHPGPCGVWLNVIWIDFIEPSGKTGSLHIILKRINHTIVYLIYLFVANDGGTKLSKSDLLLSMITSKWDGATARDEIYGFVDHLSEGLDARNKLDKDFIMKSCLVLSDLDTSYNVANFTTSNMKLIEANWKRIKISLEATFRLINRFGINGENLTSVNALLPIAYYIYRLGRGSLDGSTPFESTNTNRIHLWLLGSLLNTVFG